MIYLHPKQVIALIRQAETEGETIVIRSIKKGSNTVLQDLHCTTKPKRVPKAVTRKIKTDHMNGTLSVFVNNHRNRGGKWGTWKQISINKVQKIIYKSKEYEVKAS